MNALLEAYEKFERAGMLDKAYACLHHSYEEDPGETYPYLKAFRAHVKQSMADNPVQNMELLKQAYTLSAKEKFDDFIIAMEWNKPTKAKFYLPRRSALLPVVNALQDLEEGKLDLLCISMPPGVGKTATALFYLDWIGGRHPELATLTASHNNAFLQGAYEEVLRELTTEDYRWKEIFVGHDVAKTNAKDMQIAVDKPQRFPTYQFTSIGAGNAGKVRAMQLLYCDDLISDIEEAMSKERLDKKWQAYTVDLKQRKQGNCKELHIATRWSVHDIIGRLEDEHGHDPRARFIRMPALNEKGESNFDYGGSAGFTTEYFQEIKDSMDDVSFRALYMNEPIEREGLLYVQDDLRTYTNLPEDDPDAILAVCDTAEGGGDDTVMPIFAVYGPDHYLIDVVCSNALPEVTDALCTNALVRNKVQKCQFESNSAGGRTADKISEMVRSKNYFCHITKKKTTANKETKIIVESDWIKANVLFMDRSIIPKGGMYQEFMKKLCGYTVMGKNKHDDCVDAIAQYSQFYRRLLGYKAEIISRKVLGL